MTLEVIRTYSSSIYVYKYINWAFLSLRREIIPLISKIERYKSVSRQHIQAFVTDDLVSKSDKNMLGGETDKITFVRIKYKFRTSRNNNTVEYNVLVQQNGIHSKVRVEVFLSDFLSRSGMWPAFN